MEIQDRWSTAIQGRPTPRTPRACAKCGVIGHEYALITSTNLTDRRQTRSLEAESRFRIGDSRQPSNHSGRTWWTRAWWYAGKRGRAVTLHGQQSHSNHRAWPLNPCFRSSGRCRGRWSGGSSDSECCANMCSPSNICGTCSRPGDPCIADQDCCVDELGEDTLTGAYYCDLNVCTTCYHGAASCKASNECCSGTCLASGFCQAE